MENINKGNMTISFDNSKKSDNGNNIDLSICIVSWNIKAKLYKCLDSINKYSEDLELEIIVVDNASSDNTVELIKKDFSNIKLIENNTNRGFGKANNQALKICKGKYILLLNPDIILIEPCLKQMISFLKHNGDGGLIGCSLINIDGNIQKSYFNNFPSLVNEFFEGLLLNRIKREVLRNSKQPKETIQVGWIIVGCMMFPREVIERVKGFNEIFFMYGEDVELCFRLSKLNYKIYYLPSIKMFHYHAASSKKQKRVYFSSVLQKESMFKFLQLHYSDFNAYLYKCIWLISSLFRLSLSVVIFIPAFFGGDKIRRKFIYNIKNFSKIILWVFGYEKWVKY